MYVYGIIVEPSGFRVLGLVVALGVPFNKHHPLSVTLAGRQSCMFIGAKNKSSCNQLPKRKSIHHALVAQHSAGLRGCNAPLLTASEEKRARPWLHRLSA